MEDADVLGVRMGAGVAAADLARAAGVHVTNLYAYERGAKQPSAATVARLRTAVGAGRESLVHRHRLLTLPACAAALRPALVAGWPTADCLRLVRQLRSDAGQVRDAADRAAMWAEPTTTRSPQWDALLAGAAAMESIERDEPDPSWTVTRVLDRLWWVSSSRSLTGWLLANSPPPMLQRGVVIDPDDLGSV